MRRGTWLTDQIDVTVSGLFTTHHRLQTLAGILGEFTMPPLRRSVVYRTVEGRELVMKQTSWWHGTHDLREDGVVLGTARALGLFRRESTVRFGGRDYRLRATGFWGRVWHLVDDAKVLVEVRPRGVFQRGAILRILSSVDADLLAFTYYLVNARWQEQTTAAGAGAAAAS